MKKVVAMIAICVAAITLIVGCGEEPLEDVAPPESFIGEEIKGEGYADGIYRGFYQNGSLEEMAVQFELEESKFVEINFRSIKYKDGNYLSDQATDIQKQIASQYRQAGAYLIGKKTDAIKELQQPESVVSDMDAVTGATLNTDKLAAALQDGLLRKVFKPTNSNMVIVMEEYPDGLYRGTYEDGGVEQISVELEVKDNEFVSIKYNSLNYGDKDYLEATASGVVKEIAEQYKEAAAYLEGKSLSALSDLYEPGKLVEDRDAVTGPTLRTNKLISAINHALAGGPRGK